MTDDEWRTLKDDIARINRERRRRIQAQRLREFALRALDWTVKPDGRFIHHVNGDVQFERPVR